MHDPHAGRCAGPARHVEPGRRRAQVAQLDARRAAAAAEVGIVGRAPCAGRPRRAGPARAPRAAPRATPAAACRRPARRRSRALRAERGGLRDAWRRSAPAVRVRHDVGPTCARPRRRRRRPRPRARRSGGAVRGLAVGRANRPRRRPRGAQLTRLGSTPRPGRWESTMRPSRSPSPRTARRRSAGGRRGRRSRRARRTARPGAMPSSDSIMQPSMTPSPSARAACTMRTASRMPPDLASLMMIPSA